MITFWARNYRYGRRQVLETVAHELAHAWYGDTVTPDDWSEVWMNEGMAMYVEALYSTSQGWRTWIPTGTGSSTPRRRPLAVWLYGPPGAYKPSQFAQVNVYYCTARMLVRLPLKRRAATYDSRRAPLAAPNTAKRVPEDHVDWIAASSGQDRAALRAWFDEWLDVADPSGLTGS